MTRTDGLSYISATLKGASEVMTDAERAMALDCFKHWQGECERIGTGDPLRVAFTLHEIIDEHARAMLKKSPHGPDVKCRAGCAACCSIHVDISPHEAALLLAWCREYGIAIDRTRLERQATKTDATWHELAPKDRACVFLAEDRTCKVYEHRPGSCRKYFVKTDPDLCDMAKHPGGKVGVVFDVQAEVIHSAAMTVYGGGGMAAQLLAAEGSRDD